MLLLARWEKTSVFSSYWQAIQFPWSVKVVQQAHGLSSRYLNSWWDAKLQPWGIPLFTQNQSVSIKKTNICILFSVHLSKQLKGTALNVQFLNGYRVEVPKVFSVQWHFMMVAMDRLLFKSSNNKEMQSHFDCVIMPSSYRPHYAGRSGLAATWLTAVWEDEGLNPTVGSRRFLVKTTTIYSLGHGLHTLT